MVVATIALIGSFTGGAFATVALNQVVSTSIKDGQVKNVDLANGSVTSAKIRDGQVNFIDLSSGAKTKLREANDARYLRGTVTVTAKSPAIPVGNFDGATATCPTGMQAIGGGGDPSNVLSMSLTGSNPVISGSNPTSLANGLHPAATAWRAFARNDSAGAPATVTAIAICAPIGQPTPTAEMTSAAEHSEGCSAAVVRCHGRRGRIRWVNSRRDQYGRWNVGSRNTRGYPIDSECGLGDQRRLFTVDLTLGDWLVSGSPHWSR